MLVLKEFIIDEKGKTFLTIRGRQEGLISWFLAKIGLDPTVEMLCNRQRVLYKSSSARNGQLNISVPNVAVTAVVTGYHKPFYALVWAVICVVGGLYMAAFSAKLIIAGLLLGIIFALYYLLNKTMVFGLYNGGDKYIAYLEAKRSVIEGVTIDFEKFEQAAALLNKAILASKANAGQAKPGQTPTRV